MPFLEANGLENLLFIDHQTISKPVYLQAQSKFVCLLLAFIILTLQKKFFVFGFLGSFFFFFYLLFWFYSNF